MRIFSFFGGLLLLWLCISGVKQIRREYEDFEDKKQLNNFIAGLFYLLVLFATMIMSFKYALSEMNY